VNGVQKNVDICVRMKIFRDVELGKFRLPAGCIECLRGRMRVTMRPPATSMTYRMSLANGRTSGLFGMKSGLTDFHLGWRNECIGGLFSHIYVQLEHV
jgi:hypothetical protein